MHSDYLIASHGEEPKREVIPQIIFSRKGEFCHVLGLRNVCGSNGELFELSSVERHVVADPFNRVSEANALKLLELFNG